MAKIKSLQIAFNIDDPYQKELYEYAKSRGNISLYGKTLIARDKSGNLGTRGNIIEENIDETLDLTTDILEGFK